ncbi:hypothetical protein [uncultured Sphingorhabdus sp.]|uniref:hypothetical protein n=1 Tax=uncultured Sphingorhabdus sp. TaxID=1686106 RepID=UPI0026222B38|nr:hypothetical protein [uncultured Sphingorhabdus sp.]HMS18980.1 hypothetical protein [Sphingorhabdus sp.]
MICVETPLDNFGAPAMLPKIFGKPAIFHQVKQLQRLGVDDIIIAVDAIPGELPQLVEQMRAEGGNVRLLRPVNFSEADYFDGPFLLVAPELWLDDGLLQEVLSWKANSVGTVEEGPANGLFERIDLNRRWSGVAVLEAGILLQSKEMPEGWSLASFLLRHSLQLGASEVAISQQRITDGSLLHVSSTGDYEKIIGSHFLEFRQSGTMEAVVANLSGGLIAPVSQRPALMAAFGWAPVVVSIASVAVAYGGHIMAALAVYVLALCLETLRQQLRAIEYHVKANDYLSWAIQFAGTATLLASFWRSGESLVDMSFLTTLLVALVLMSHMSPKDRTLRTISPLAVTLSLLIGLFLFPLSLVAKSVIVILLGLNIGARWGQMRNLGQLNSN